LFASGDQAKPISLLLLLPHRQASIFKSLYNGISPVDEYTRGDKEAARPYKVVE
jgi:hypothetical protein